MILPSHRIKSRRRLLIRLIHKHAQLIKDGLIHFLRFFCLKLHVLVSLDLRSSGSCVHGINPALCMLQFGRLHIFREGVELRPDARPVGNSKVSNELRFTTGRAWSARDDKSDAGAEVA